MDKTNKKVLFVNTNFNCFAEFTANYDGRDNLDYKPKRFMEIFIPCNGLQISKEQVVKWLDILERINLPNTLSQIDAVKASPNYPKRTYGIEQYVVTLDFDKYTSKAHVKLAASLVRYIYEEPLYLVIEETIKYLEEHTDADMWEVLQFIHIKVGMKLTAGHVIFEQGKHIHIQPIARLNAHINNWKKQSYTNNEIVDLCYYNYIKKPVSGYNNYADFYGTVKYDCNFTTIEAYKEFVKTLK